MAMTTDYTQLLDRVWSEADPDRLLQVARDIEARGSWVSYLSCQEYQVFREAVNRGGQTWKQFLNGSTTCIVNRFDPPSGSSNEGNGASDNNGSNTSQSGPGNESGDSQATEPVTTTITLDPLVLAFRVRFMLYERCLPLIYPETGASLEVNVASLLMAKNALSNSAQQVPISNSAKQREEDDYDDNYDDDEDEDDESNTNKHQIPNGTITNNNNNEENDSIVISVTLSAENENQTIKQKAIIDAASETFARTYHIFENDRENTLKQKKLQESDRQMDSYNPSNPKGTDGETESRAPTAQFGAANLSLKHLLATIDSKRDDLNLTDLELRNLIMDVRKNRSKWASEDKIGQEELYEAAEKVVMELRGYTEHSTAFLNKVSKREAPNYSSIIKHPMDLNTVMKKLKGFQYNSKQEFVDDIMLIWSNCLTYNSDPNHFLRAHAIAMQKKTISLIPLIPDVKVRDRKEVEAEERAANANANNSDEEDEEAESAHGKHSTKGRKRKLDHNEEADKATKSRKKPDGKDFSENDDSKNKEKDDQLDDKEAPKGNGNAPDESSMNDSTNNKHDRSYIDQKIDELNEQHGRSARSATPNTPWSPTPGSEIDTELTETLKEESSNQTSNNVVRGVYEEDLESQTWQKLYSKQRAEYCEARSALFTKDDKLAADSTAALRLPVNMAKFADTASNMFRSLEDYHQSRAFLMDTLGSVERPAFILEYEANSGLPPIPESCQHYMLFDDPDYDSEDIIEAGLRRRQLGQDKAIREMFVAKGGTADKIDNNLAEMQYIRKVCSKISLVRQMQQPSYVPTLHGDTSVFGSLSAGKPGDCSTATELDTLSCLPTHDPYNDQVCAAVMRKAVAKLAMHQGFEFCEMSALDSLQEITADFMGKLGRTLCMYLQESEDIRMDSEDMVKSTLLDNGVGDVKAIDNYIRDNIDRFGTKIRDLKRNMTTYMGDLLRPITSLANEFTDKQFTDNSEQFLSGDFSTELGDDFFGFKELGLDREFGLLSNAVPFHLLQGRLNASLNPQADKPVNELVMEQIPDYPSMDHKLAEYQIGLLKPFFIGRLESVAGSQKEKAEAQGNAHPHIHLMEGDNLPPKQRNNRPRVPPTGKIVAPKRKSFNQMFVIPIVPVNPPSDDSQTNQDINQDMPGKKQPSNDDEDQKPVVDDAPVDSQVTASQNTQADVSMEIDMDDLDRSLDMIV